MAKTNDLQTPCDLAWETPPMEGFNIASRGGYDLGEGTQYETPNSISGLPLQPTIITLGGDAPSRGDQVPLPDLSQGGLTIPSPGKQG